MLIALGEIEDELNLKKFEKQIANKFNAFRLYATEHKLHCGFVRDKDCALYINNTVFSEDKADEH